MIELTDDDCDKIESFIEEMWQAGKSSKREDFEQAYRLGKGAEQAVAHFLNDKYNIDAEVDYDVYVGTDTSDLLPYSAEVKVMPDYGNWVAIPVDRARNIGSQEPIIIVKHHSDTSFEVVGWCLKEDLHLIEQGEKPFTAKADNLCTRLSNISDDWRTCCEKMGADPTHNFTFTD